MNRSSFPTEYNVAEGKWVAIVNFFHQNAFRSVGWWHAATVVEFNRGYSKGLPQECPGAQYPEAMTVASASLWQMPSPQSIEKPAPVAYPILDLLRRRWSPVAFSERPVEREKLQSVLEAARWSASSFGEQPWSFLVAASSDRDEFTKMLGCLVEKNQEWARHASVLMISVAALNFARNGKPNRHAFHDVGQAAAYLTMEAMEQGLWVHQMAGIDLEKIREIYALPNGYEPVAGIALGYAATAEHLPEGLQQRHASPRSRKPLADFVFTGKWGEPSGLI